MENKKLRIMRLQKIEEMRKEYSDLCYDILAKAKERNPDSAIVKKLYRLINSRKLRILDPDELGQLGN